MKSILLSLIALATWMVTPSVLHAALDTAGTEYYFAFLPNFTFKYASNRSLSLLITGKEDTQGTVTIPDLNFTQSFVVQANKVTNISIPVSAQFLSLNTIYTQHDQQTKLGVHVVAQKEVTIYGANVAQVTGDAFTALPVTSLGLEYIAMSDKGVWYSCCVQWDWPSELAVVGAFDNTTVTITPSVETRGRLAGIPFTVTLNKGDTYLITGARDNDLTGTVISSTEPVAVMSGANAAPAYINDYLSHIVEMMPPVSTWGKSFLTVPLGGNQRGEVIRILASQDNTSVKINGVSVSTLARGKFYETTLIDRSQIETSAPALVAQYARSADYGNIPSPFMMLITPTEQFLNQSTISTVSGTSSNFINIIAPTASIASLRLDGLPINAALFVRIGSSEFSGAQVPISAGTHIVNGDVPIGIYVYGYGIYGIGATYSYGYPGGRSFQPINQAGDSFVPTIKLTQVGDTIQGIVTDSEDINCNGLLNPGEDLNNNGIIDRRSEDLNGNGILDPGEDLNADGMLDKDKGVFRVELEAGSNNLKLDVLPFIPGEVTAYFSVSLLDPKLPGNGILRVSDGVGNVTSSPVILTGVPLLKNVRIIDTISTANIDIDNSTFSKLPFSTNVVGDRTVIEWRFDTFSADAVQDIGFDLVVKNPLAGEQRLVSHKLELHYVDPNGRQVSTELDSQYVKVLNAAIDSSLTLDKAAYQANETAQLAARVINLSEYARVIDAKIVVEDSQGGLVKDIAIVSNLSFTAGTIKELADISFNTGAMLAGDYRVHLFLTDNNRQVGESIVAFKIQPTTTLKSKIITDKASYVANSQVAITASIQSQSTNYVFSDLNAKITITNSLGNILFAESKTIPQLVQNQLSASNSFWRCSTYPKGVYTVQLDIFDGATLLSSAQSSFEIIGSVISGGLSGTATIQPNAIEYGADGSIAYSLANKGNEDIANAIVRILIVDPDSSQVVRQFEPLKSIVVPMAGVLTGQIVLPTAGLALKDYLIVMQLEHAGGMIPVASTSFAVKDTTPPEVTIISPEKDGIYNSSIVLSVIATDKVSDVRNIEYQLTDGIWNSLPVDDSAAGKYAIVWEPTAGDNGVRTVKFRAFDFAGNQSNPVSVTVTVDSIPPALTVSTLANDSYTNQETLNVAGIAMDSAGAVSLDINGSVVAVAADGSFSQAILLQEGGNVVTVTAADIAGNRSSDSRTINLDRKAPLLKIAAPADNCKTAVALADISGTVDESSVVTVKLGNDTWTTSMNGTEFAAALTLTPGLNTIEVTATDLANNTSSQKRTVLFDDQTPALAITEPAQDTRTNKSSLTVSGSTSDPYTAVGVTVAVESTIMSPPVVNGIFSQIVTFGEEKLYPIVVTATNEVGTGTTAVRNVIFDNTPPTLTIDPVTSPTNAPSQVITGTREEGTAVSVSCATAAMENLEYPTGTTWRVAVSNMQEGANLLKAEAADQAGNLASASTIVLYVPKAPDVTVNASPQRLWPPNKKLVAVTVGGGVVTHGAGVREVTISVADEYGKYNLQGLKFGDTVWLEAWRDGNDKDGRIYTITAVVTDQAGNRTTRTTTVAVPHDVGK